MNAGTVDAQDLKHFHVTDSPSEAVDLIKEAAMRRFGLTYAPGVRRHWYFRE